MRWEAPVSCLVFKPTCQKEKARKIHGNYTWPFQSLHICARQFLWLSAGEKIGLLPSQRLQSVTSSWIWFEWTTYGFSSGLKRTSATHFPHRTCILDTWMNTAQSLETAEQMRWVTLSLGGFFKERFHLERFSTWPTQLDCMSLGLSLTLVQIVF